MRKGRQQIVAGISWGLAALAFSTGAWSDEQPYHLRGTLASVEGDTLTIETDEEETVEVKLAKDAAVLTVEPATLEEVKQGDYVGITSVESDGERMAVGMHIFGEDLRGAAEGHSSWDLVKEPNTMTNATVAEVADVGEDRQLVLSYEQEEGEQTVEGSQTIRVPDFLEIVRLVKAPSRAVLEPDRRVFLIVRDAKDGVPSAQAAVVGSEGATPPM